MSTEEWRTILSHPSFEASSLGQIRGGKRGGIKKQRLHATGRWHMRVGNTTQFVHILICEAFHGPKPNPTDTVDHINRDHKDNRPENLRWVSRTVQARNHTGHLNKGFPLYINHYINQTGTQFYAIKVEIPGTRGVGGTGRKFRHKALNIEHYTLEDAIRERDAIMAELGVDA